MPVPLRVGSGASARTWTVAPGATTDVPGLLLELMLVPASAGGNSGTGTHYWLSLLTWIGAHARAEVVPVLLLVLADTSAGVGTRGGC